MPHRRRRRPEPGRQRQRGGVARRVRAAKEGEGPAAHPVGPVLGALHRPVGADLRKSAKRCDACPRQPREARMDLPDPEPPHRAGDRAFGRVRRPERPREPLAVAGPAADPGPSVRRLVDPLLGSLAHRLLPGGLRARSPAVPRHHVGKLDELRGHRERGANAAAPLAEGPREKGLRDAGRRREAGDVVDARGDGVQRRLLGSAAVAGHDPGRGLEHRIEGGVIVVGPGLGPRPGADLARDDLGVDHGELVVGDAERACRAVEEVVKHDVRSLDEAGEGGLSGLGLEVEDEGALALVDVDPEPHGREGPRLGGRGVDADDVRPMLGKGPSRGRTGDDVREVEHPHPLEKPAGPLVCPVAGRRRGPFQGRGEPREGSPGRCRRPERRRTDRVVLDGEEAPRLPHRAAGRVLEIGRYPGGPEVRVGQPLGARLDHRHGDVRVPHHRLPLLGGAGLRGRPDELDEALAPRRGQAGPLVDVVARVVLHVRVLAHHALGDDLVVHPEHLEEGAVLVDVVGGADEEDPAVRALVEVDRGVGVAGHVLRDLRDVLLGQVAAKVAERGEYEVQHRVVDGREVVARGLSLDLAGEQGHGGHHAVGERHLDVLAAAGALPVVEPEGGGEASEHPAVGGGHGDGRIDGRAEEGAEHADVGVDADGGVDDPLPGGDAPQRIALREAGEGDVDEISAPCVERGMVEPQGGGGPRAHVLQHHVGLGGPLPAGAPRRLVLQVDLDEALSAVQQGVDGVRLAARPHELDHVRPLVGEQHRGHPARPPSTEIEHAYRRERCGPFLSRSCHFFPPKAHPAGARSAHGRPAATGAVADCSRGSRVEE